MNRIDEKLKLLQPVLGIPKTQKLRQMYFFEDNFRLKNEIENHVDLLISRLVKRDADDKIILPPPPKESCEGELAVGTIEYLDKAMYPFALGLKDINRHLGIFGSTGSGKTTFALNLIRQLHQKRIPFLVFDWKKATEI